jgi:predicted alpha/beta superfamily hydrolase
MNGRATLVRWCVLALILAGPIRLQGRAQNYAVTLGQKVQVESKLLKQSRSLSVLKPDDYDDGSERYPVLYVLDGEENFEYTAAIVRFLAGNDRIPEMIVVAIDSGDVAQRTHDLTPPSRNEIENRFSPNNGGAEAFLAFVSDELIPYVDRNYRTRPYRILIGHSFGGLFALHALATKPMLFNAYIVIDPTAGWNDGAEIVRIQQLISGMKDLRAALFISAANDLGRATPDVQRLTTALEGNKLKSFRWKFEWMKGETHGSIPLLSVYSGLCTIFDGWYLTDPLQVFDEGGLPAIDRHFREGGERAGYERRTPAFTVSILVAALIQKGRLEEAAMVLLHDPKAYPPPWNQLDALARAYAGRGNTEQAIRFYRLSLQENPSNEWARQKLQEMKAGADAVQKHEPH